MRLKITTDVKSLQAEQKKKKIVLNYGDAR